MGWQDRDYASDDGYARATGRRRPLIPAGWKISVVLLVINVGLFLIASPRSPLFEVLVMHAPSVLHGQVWRLLSACFLHWDGGHLFFNMIGLYFFGPALEHSWGRRRFLIVYLIAGVVANIIYVLLYAAGWSSAAGIAAGASGCIYAVLGACAMVMPHIRVLLFFMIPMNIRSFLALFVIWGIYNVWTGGPNAGGDLVHLAGLGVGLGYAWWQRGGVKRSSRRLTAPGSGPSAGAWKRKLEEQRELEVEVDRILTKIRESGIGSLSEQERALLAQASRDQKTREQEYGRTDRL